MKRKQFIFLMLCTYFLLSHSIFGIQNTIEINNPQDKIKIFNHLSFYQEKGNISFDQERLNDSMFSKPKTLTVYHKKRLKNETLWIKFSLDNKTKKDLVLYYILQNPYTYNATLYTKNKKQGIKKYFTYSYLNIKKEHRLFNFPTWNIDFPKNEETTVYLKIYEVAGDRTKILCQLKNQIDFLEFRGYAITYYILFIGFCVISILLCVYIAFFTNHKFILFFAGYILAILFDFLCIKSLGQSYIWRKNLFLLNNIRSISNGFGALSISLFLYYLYNFLTLKSWIKKVFLIFSFVFCTLLSMYLFKYIFDGFTYLYICIWKTISILAIALITTHLYLAYKKKIPFYLPFVFIIHSIFVFINSNFIFEYNHNLLLDWLILDSYYLSFGLEIIVWLIFIFYKFKNEKYMLINTIEENIQIKNRYTKIKHQYTKIKNQSEIENTQIQLNNGDLIFIKNIIYIKSDGHYIEFYLVIP